MGPPDEMPLRRGSPAAMLELPKSGKSDRMDQQRWQQHCNYLATIGDAYRC
jgi:hypothetical protein